MMHPHVFVAQTTGAHLNHFYKAVLAANEYPGPALVVCYASCMPEHGVADDRSACEPDGTAPGPGDCSGGGTVRTGGGNVFPCIVNGRAATLDTYVCRLDLPSGALIEEIQAYGYDSSNASYFEAATWATANDTFGPTYYSNFAGTWQNSGLAAAPGTTSFPIFTLGTTPHAVLSTSRYVIGFATYGTSIMAYGFRVRYTMP